MGVDSGRIDLEHDDDPVEARDLSGEPDPSGARYVDANPRAFLKRGLRYLDGAARS
jgi:hypothetical protein